MIATISQNKIWKAPRPNRFQVITEHPPNGVIADPRSCKFDPATVAGLSSAQVGALRTAYDGVRAADGQRGDDPVALVPVVLTPRDVDGALGSHGRAGRADELAVLAADADRSHAVR